MRHVPIAEFDPRTVELFAAAASGEEIVITDHGRDVIKLVAIPDDEGRAARKRAAVDALVAIGQRIKAKHGPTTDAEIREWLEDGRR